MTVTPYSSSTEDFPRGTERERWRDGRTFPVFFPCLERTPRTGPWTDVAGFPLISPPSPSVLDPIPPSYAWAPLRHFVTTTTTIILARAAATHSSGADPLACGVPVIPRHSFISRKLLPLDRSWRGRTRDLARFQLGGCCCCCCCCCSFSLFVILSLMISSSYVTERRPTSPLSPLPIQRSRLDHDPSSALKSPRLHVGEITVAGSGRF